MENSNMIIYPNPPQHYKDFEYSDSAKPIPDINLLNKINTFMTFGKEYQIKEINFNKTQVDSNFLKFFDERIIATKGIPNQNLFNNLNNIDSFDIFEAFQNELKFIRKTYIELLGEIREKIEDTDLSNCLLKYSFQKIFYLISVLRKKQVIKSLIKGLYTNYKLF
jgi:hypothetical protein